MAITSEDYRREAREKLLAEATLEERLKGLDPEQRLKGLDAATALRVLFPNATEEQIQEMLLQARGSQ